jgi:hypothetical protein
VAVPFIAAIEGVPMFEKYMIMTRGFGNVRHDGEVTGFQFNLRTTY